MKQLILIFATVIALTTTTQAQSLKQLINKASNIENVEQVKIGGFLLSIGKMFTSTSDLPSISKNIKKIEVFDFTSCNTTEKNNVIQDIKNIQTQGEQEVLMLVKDKGDYVKIMTQKNKKNSISEINILIASQNNPSIIRLIGTISQADIDQLLNEYNNG